MSLSTLTKNINIFNHFTIQRACLKKYLYLTSIRGITLMRTTPNKLTWLCYEIIRIMFIAINTLFSKEMYNLTGINTN